MGGEGERDTGDGGVGGEEAGEKGVVIGEEDEMTGDEGVVSGEKRQGDRGRWGFDR